MNEQILYVIPDVQPRELPMIQNVLDTLPEDKHKVFLATYRGRRKPEQDILMGTLAAFLGVAGIQRFMLGQIGMGVVYLFTGGFCLVGTIIDLINYKTMVYQYNEKIAIEVAQMLHTPMLR